METDVKWPKNGQKMAKKGLPQLGLELMTPEGSKK